MKQNEEFVRFNIIDIFVFPFKIIVYLVLNLNASKTKSLLAQGLRNQVH